jgi:hypothetical protein
MSHWTIQAYKIVDDVQKHLEDLDTDGQYLDVS